MLKKRSNFLILVLKKRQLELVYSDCKYLKHQEPTLNQMLYVICPIIIEAETIFMTFYGAMHFSLSHTSPFGL